MGKGRAGSTKANTRWLVTGVLLVVLSCVAAFAMLRLDHARQVEATRQGFFLYSSRNEDALDFAHSLRDRTGIETLDLEAPSTLQRLKSRELVYEGRDSALLLPSSIGWIQVRDEKTIEEALMPLTGVPTAHLRGAFGALALAAVWALFGFWRAPVAYLGSAWPVVGIVALGLAAPLCKGCMAGSEGLGPFSALAGLLGFVAVLFVLAFRGRGVQGAMIGVAALAIAAGIGQAYLLTRQPKFCPACILGGAAYAGIFVMAAQALGRRKVRTILFGRAMAGTAVALGLLFAFRHAQAGLNRPEVTREADFTTTIGSSLREYVASTSPPTAGLYLISIAGCESCDLAMSDLRRHRVPFREISYCSIGRRENCFDADFPQVSPLFLICDSTGKILHAEAGWMDDPYQQTRFFERIRKWRGKLNETQTNDR